jgi:hypothetical protein
MQLRLIINDATRRLDQRLRDWITSFNSVGLELADDEVMLSHLNEEVTDYITSVNGDSNIDGGRADTIYLPSQNYNGGGA